MSAVFVVEHGRYVQILIYYDHYMNSITELHIVMKCFENIYFNY